MKLSSIIVLALLGRHFFLSVLLIFGTICPLMLLIFPL